VSEGEETATEYYGAEKERLFLFKSQRKEEDCDGLIYKVDDFPTHRSLSPSPERTRGRERKSGFHKRSDLSNWRKHGRGGAGGIKGPDMEKLPAPLAIRPAYSKFLICKFGVYIGN
jgi:hypothetical protein